MGANIRRMAKWQLLSSDLQRLNMLQESHQVALRTFDGSVDISTSDVKVIRAKRCISEEFLPV